LVQAAAVPQPVRVQQLPLVLQGSRALHSLHLSLEELPLEPQVSPFQRQQEPVVLEVP